MDRPGPGRQPGGRSTPFATEELLEEARQLQRWLDEIAALSASGLPWGLRQQLRNVELALRRPETLASLDNQLDFVEELAEAVWQPQLELATAAPDEPAGQGESNREASARQRRAEALWERLDACAERLCERVERWHRGLQSEAAGFPRERPPHPE